ncbi:MAG: prephenate dehydrogenase/arogenate dehydrogenase family protein [Gemmatimonadota bacterium]|nr:prephenate dehydrogenase/arogenate dehydrogenase family protein [Gemmatimonadota bacterium]
MIERPVAIVGLGVIGGSLARALGDGGVEVRAWSQSASDRAAAEAAGVPVVHDVTASLVELTTGAAIVMLAIPIQELAPLITRMLPSVERECVVLHAGSLQRQRSIGLDDSSWDHVFGTHPFTGSEGAGFSYSRPDLFRGAAVSIESRAPPHSRRLAESLWRAAGIGRFDVKSAEDHDRLMVWMSHLPQLAATALASTLAAAGASPADAGPGARDTTRLAASPLALWSALLGAATPENVAAVRALEETLGRLRVAIEEGDGGTLGREWESARRWRHGVEAAR